MSKEIEKEIRELKETMEKAYLNCEVELDEYDDWDIRVGSLYRTLGMLHSIATLGLTTTVALYSVYGADYFDDIYLQDNSILKNTESEQDILKTQERINKKLIENENIIAQKFGLYLNQICQLIREDYEAFFKQDVTKIDVFEYEEAVSEGIEGIIANNGFIFYSLGLEEQLIGEYFYHIKDSSLGKAILKLIDEILQRYGRY